MSKMLAKRCNESAVRDLLSLANSDDRDKQTGENDDDGLPKMRVRKTPTIFMSGLTDLYTSLSTI